MRNLVYAWLGRVALSLLAALVAGALAYLLARAVSGVWLFVYHQQLLREVAGALQGGVESLPGGNLRAARQALAQLAQQHEQISLAAGFVAAALAVLASYLWLERRAAASYGREQKG